MKRMLTMLVLLSLLLPGVTSALASTSSFVYRGGAWTLVLHPKKAWYGTGVRGSLTFRGKRYHVEGDWIPAGDAGGDLLRFYGHPFTPNSPLGLVGLATLYSTCVPNCATSRRYNLTPVKPYGIPGDGSGRPIVMVLQP